MKVRILKDFAWYKKGQVIDIVEDGQFHFLEKLGFVKKLSQLEVQQYDNVLEPLINDNCSCGCCKDALARLHTTRNLLDACWCHLSKENEQCHCPFCRQCLFIRAKGKNKND